MKLDESCGSWGRRKLEQASLEWQPRPAQISVGRPLARLRNVIVKAAWEGNSYSLKTEADGVKMERLKRADDVDDNDNIAPNKADKTDRSN